MKVIKGIFLEKIFPKTDEDDDDFKIVKYLVTSDPSGLEVPYQISVKGYGLPESLGIESTLYLKSKEESKYGDTFICDKVIIDIPKTKIGMEITLTKTSKIISLDKFNKLYNQYKERTLYDLITDGPAYKDKLITQTNKEALEDFKNFLTNSFVRAIVFKAGLSEEVANGIVDSYKDKSIFILKTNPHALVLKKAISFSTAEELIKNYNASRKTLERFLSVGLESIRRAEKGGKFIKVSGASCIEYNHALKVAIEILDIADNDAIKKKMSDVFIKLQELKLISPYIHGKKVYLYLADGFKAEVDLAENINKFIKQGNINIKNIDRMIENQENKNGFKLAPEQRKAVTAALTHKIAVITGGPGTGKSATSSTIK